MDAYAPALVDHNIPLVVVSGLSSPNVQYDSPVVGRGYNIISEEPLITQSEDAHAILLRLQELDARDLSWQSSAGQDRVRVKIIARVRSGMHPFDNARLKLE